jgi:CheY-like chemotaxis protein
MNPLVLIVDDDANLRSLARVVLARAGFDVATAADGEEGLIQVERLSPDVVLLDMNMPNVDGRAFLERLPMACRGLLPLVVACSGAPELRRDAIAAGAAAFLTKPVESLELVREIRRVLSDSRNPTVHAA